MAQPNKFYFSIYIYCALLWWHKVVGFYTKVAAVWGFKKAVILSNLYGALIIRSTIPKTPTVVFDDYDSYTENEIAGISPNGISLKNMKFINFRECAYNFQQVHGGKGTCVAERDITGTNPSFGFYTAPKTTHIFFLPKSKIKEFFSKRNTLQRFQDLQKQIESFGFTTYDMSWFV